MQKYISVYSNH